MTVMMKETMNLNIARNTLSLRRLQGSAFQFNFEDGIIRLEE